MSDSLYKPATTAVQPKTLSPELYRKLKEQFGDVQVANPGSTAYKFPAMYAGDKTTWKGGEYLRVSCPFCHDDRRRLWISYMYGQLDEGNRLLTNVAHCFNEQCLDVPENAERLKDVLLGFQNYSTRRRAVFQLADSEWSDEPTVTMTPTMPEAVLPFEQLVAMYPQHPAVAYMLGERRYTMEQLDHYEIGYCISSSKFPEASNRIIFPLVMHERLMGWQARFVGKPESKRVNKYYGMPGMQKQFILYNFDNAADKPFTVLFEGVTDVHRLGDYSMAVLGKTLSPVHKSLLAQAFLNKPIFVGLDPDAEDYGGRAVAELRSMALRAYPLTFPNNLDPSDMEQEALIGLIRHQAKQVGEQI